MALQVLAATPEVIWSSRRLPRIKKWRALRISLALLVLCAAPAMAQSNKVRITNLTDVAFGTVTNFVADSVRSQNICVFAQTAGRRYRITAAGSGSGGAFTLTSGADLLPFDVQWNSVPGQSAGTQLTPNVALTSQVSAAAQQTCNSGPATSASLVILLRSADVSTVTEGIYNGTLTIVIGVD